LSESSYRVALIAAEHVAAMHVCVLLSHEQGLRDHRGHDRVQQKNKTLQQHPYILLFLSGDYRFLLAVTTAFHNIGGGDDRFMFA